MAGNKFLLPAVGAAIVVAGGAAAYFYYFKGTSIADPGPAAIAKVVPDDAYMAAYISTDTDRWAKLEQFGTPAAQKVIRDQLGELKQSLAKDAQLDYDKDLKPWVGDVMVAFLPTTGTAPAKEPQALFVVSIKDKIKASEFANNVKKKAAGKTKANGYKGVEITEFSGGNSPTYTAVVNDYLVMAPEQTMVQQAIDTTQGEPSFAAKPEVGGLLSRGVDVKNPVVRVYMPDYAVAMQEFAKSNPNQAPLPPATLNQLKQVKSLVAGIGIDDSGLRMKAETKLDPQAIATEFKPSSGKIISRFPATTVGLISGAGIDRFWSQFTEQAKSNPDTQQGLDQARQQFKTINIDLDKEIFGWMNGEFALGIIPSNEGIVAPVGFGGGILLGTSDRKTAESTLTKFDTIVGAASVQVEKRDAGGKQITEWKTPQGVVLGHGWLDNDTLFIAIGGQVVEAIANKSGSSLDNSDTFKAVTESFPKTNMGYFYLDMDGTLALIKKGPLAAQGADNIPPDANAILDSIRGIGVTSTQTDKTTAQVEMLLSLKPAK